MTTFTLGLGTNGQLGVYVAITSPADRPTTTRSCPAPRTGPRPSGDTLTTIDDLWHAAVNGHGQYFSAKNPDLLVSGLRTALAGVSAREAAGAAAATSNLEPVAGDNSAFVANYRTVKWDGDVQSRTIDLVTGAISEHAELVGADAARRVRHRARATTRTIFTYLGGSKVSFAVGSFTAAQKLAWFTPTASPALSQTSGWTPAQTLAATADTVINYLRGQYGFEERSANPIQLYRFREHVLGDIIDGKPVYVKNPPFNYSENNYQTFKTGLSRAGRGLRRRQRRHAARLRFQHRQRAVGLRAVLRAAQPQGARRRQLPERPPVLRGRLAGRRATCGPARRGRRSWSAASTAAARATTRSTSPTRSRPTCSGNSPTRTWATATATRSSPSSPTPGTWVVAFTSGYNNTPVPGNTSADGEGRLYVLNAYTGTLRFSHQHRRGQLGVAFGPGQDQRLGGRRPERQHHRSASTAATCSATCGASTSTTSFRRPARRPRSSRSSRWARTCSPSRPPPSSAS